ncbi:hypothetical protein B4U80_09496 [Leptotrombidium deliense]|uniref:ZP domain-containing protein n=1 Tax=Leptotrombidium deliense TaxID=299467 RepID=A0A443SJL6_9ACAR|nr:hypothetical protein B4U80_09496 [Leptotrombidium deliense]
MIVKINFNAPFRGVAYANYDRSSHCKFYGDGSTYYEMIIPLKGCGTKQEAPRLFLNNIIFRFHRTLELEEDEIKTIICRYPPPLAPPPVDPVPPILEPTSPTPIILPTKLSEIELLLIICGLLFLTLLLLGIGIAYYCLKRRNIKIVRKKKLSTGPPSEITKLSQSTVFDQIRIPRATAHSTESSETIPSDYPSESLSEDERRTIVSETSTMRQDQYKYANAAFVPEPYPMDVEKADSVSNIPVPAMHKPNITSKMLDETYLETQNFTDEDIINTTHKRIISQLYKKFLSKHTPPSIPDNDIPEAGAEVIEEVPRRRHEIPSPAPSLKGSIPDDDVWSHSEMDEAAAVVPYVKRKRLDMANVDDTFIDNEQFTDVTEDTTHNKMIVYPPPKILLKQIDDFYVTNISETTTEDFLSRKSAADHRQPPSSQYQRPPPTKEILDVYTEDVERFRSDTSEMVGVSTRMKPRETVHRTREEIITTLMDHPPLVDGIDHLTPEIKRKWRTVITTDEIFRSLIVESTTTEEFIRISRDIRYEKMFEPRTWETIIRMLTHPDIMKSVETQTEDLRPTPKTRRRKSSYPGALVPRSQRPDSIVSQSSIFDYDMRSITEEDVTFRPPDRATATAYSIDMRRVETVEQPSYSRLVPFPPPLAHQYRWKRRDQIYY